MSSPILSRLSVIKSKWVFVILWTATFMLYVSTRKAGWVIDGLGLLYNIRHKSFWDFVNSTQSGDQGFYQLLTLPYYIFYSLFGMNEWFWGLLFITLQSLNALLLFIFFRNLLRDSLVKNGTLISLAAVVIFTVSPHISEVLVWRACFHYMLSFCFIISILIQVQKFHNKQAPQYIWLALLFFVLASVTHPIFYLAPVFVLLLALYYRLVLGYDSIKLRKTILLVFFPQLILLCLYFAALYFTYHTIRPHKTAFNESLTDYLSKPVKYLFHILLLGRYFSVGTKELVYQYCESLKTIVVFYSLLAIYFAFCIFNLKKLGNNSKVIFLLFNFTMITLFFLLPLYFPDSALLVFYDRYIYFSGAFVYLLVTLLISAIVKNKYLLIALFCIYLDLNLYFTIQVNDYWVTADKIINNLVRTLPPTGDKTVLLLNNPENMNGAPMIGSTPDCELKSMIEVYTGVRTKSAIYDVASYNMVADYNGAHVTVINDSVIQVGLNHMGTWWWYEGHGAVNYETPDYKVDFKTKGLLYELTLKHPADKYLLLYSVGDKWKVTDMSLKNKQQD
jgi:hypothetical protein